MIKRYNTKNKTHAHLIDAEGTSDIEPMKSEIEFLLSKEGYNAKDIEIWFDNMQGLWRWSCKIEPTS
jgi:hypothetical protein